MPAKDRRGTGNGNVKLTAHAVKAIRKAREGIKRVPASDPRSCISLARKYGITRSHVSKISLGHEWGHLEEYSE